MPRDEERTSSPALWALRTRATSVRFEVLSCLASITLKQRSCPITSSVLSFDVEKVVKDAKYKFTFHSHPKAPLHCTPPNHTYCEAFFSSFGNGEQAFVTRRGVFQQYDVLFITYTSTYCGLNSHICICGDGPGIGSPSRTRTGSKQQPEFIPAHGFRG